jgi:hypothetical protein
MSTRTALYRHFDAAGQLLYVGISNDALRRLLQHKDRAGWYEQIRRVNVEWLPDRAAALSAEAGAIRQEAPLWNVRRPATPPMHRRVAGQHRHAEGVVHTCSGLVDGWYFGGIGAHMLGWFRAVFPRDEFDLVRPEPGADNFLRNGRALKWLDHERWAASPPHFAAGDAFDRAAT